MVQKKENYTKSIINNVLRGTVKSIPFVGSFFEQVVYGTLDEKNAEAENDKIRAVLNQVLINENKNNLKLKDIIKCVTERSDLNNKVSEELNRLMSLIESPKTATITPIAKEAFSIALFSEQKRMRLINTLSKEMLSLDFDSLVSCFAGADSYLKPVSSKQQRAYQFVEWACKQKPSKVLDVLQILNQEFNITFDIREIGSRNEREPDFKDSERLNPQKNTDDELQIAKDELQIATNIKKTTVFSHSPEAVLFVYGSLLSPESMSRTIGQDYPEVEYIPVKLRRYKRFWGVPAKRSNIIDENNNPLETISWLSLIIKPSSRTSMVDGALIPVSLADFETLKNREQHYTYVEVTKNIEHVDGTDTIYKEIYTFIPKEYTAIRADYLESVNNALAKLGFEKFSVDKSIQVLKAHNADHLCEGIWLSNSKKLNNFETQMTNHLTRNKCTRRVGKIEKPIPTALRPIVLNKNMYERAKSLAEAAISISHKALQILTNDSSFSQMCGYREIDLEMVNDKLSNTRGIPEIARVDMTFNRDKFHIFEINCDSPAGMFHLNVLSEKQIDYCSELGMGNVLDLRKPTNSCQAVKNILMKSWQDYLDKLNIRKALKHIAILEQDWRIWSTRTEFEYFRDEVLNDNGVSVEICEPKELDYVDGKLISTNTKKSIDLIYKRVLWNDLVNSDQVNNPEQKKNAEQVLFGAYLDNSVCVVNSFSSRLAGNKLLLALIKQDDFKVRLKRIKLELTKSEEAVRNSIPETSIFREDLDVLNAVLETPENYVLKSFNGYGSKEVFILRTCENPKQIAREQWEKGQSIVQKSVPHGLVRQPLIDHGIRWQNSHFILGAYVIGEKCVAIEAKAAKKPPITMNHHPDGEPIGYRTAVFTTK